MLASILLGLVVLHMAMMIIGPLVALRVHRKKSWLGGRVLMSWIGFFAGYCIFSWLLKDVVGASSVLDTQTATLLALSAWATVFIGLGIVIWSFVVASRQRKQQLG